MPRARHQHGQPRYCRECGDGLIYKSGLCADCYDAGDDPREDARQWAARHDVEPDYGGALGCDGRVYSDADPGL